MKKRIFSFLVAACLAAALLPMLAWAEEGQTPAPQAETVASGNCGMNMDGSNLTWTLDDTGLLTIRGSDQMANYTESGLAPWSSYANGIKSVVIEDGVTSIGANAFSGCTALKSVTVPASVEQIGYSAFYGCSALESVSSLDNLKCIEKSTFSGCSSLTNLSIGNNATYIRENAFSGCTALTSLTIPDSVERIEMYAFSGCTGLTDMTIPGSVEIIGKGAFTSCTGLTNLTIGNGVTSIGDSAFSDCTGLTSVTIPNSVTSIGTTAFNGCSKLASVTFQGNAPTLGDRAFYGVHYGCLILIPSDATDYNQSDFPSHVNIRHLYTVTWKDENGAALEMDEAVIEGDTPSYGGETPTKAPDEDYIYTFDVWSPAVAAVTGNTTYIATYKAWPIPKAEHFDITLPAESVYDGNPRTATVAVKDNITGMGAITVKYYDSQGNVVENPTNAGTYTVKIDVAQGSDYGERSDLAVGTFTIDEAFLYPAIVDGEGNEPSIITKVYDGTTDVLDTSLNIRLDGIVGQDNVSLYSFSFAYDSKDVNATAVIANLSVLTGTDSSNYMLFATKPSVSGKITPKELTPEIALTNSEKTYDGTTEVTGASITLSTPVSGDNPSATADFAYNSPNVGEANKITATGIALDSSNYTLTTTTAEIAATISPKTVTNPKVTVTPDSYTYTGLIILPTTVEVKDGEHVIPASEYRLEISGGNQVGPITVTIVDQPGGNYIVSGTGSFTITQAEQATLTITGQPTGTIYYGDTFTLSTSGGSGSGAVTWAVTEGGSIATVDSTGNVTITGVGQVTITATKAGDTNYQAATATYTFTAQKATPDVGTVTKTNPDTIYPHTDLQNITLSRTITTVPGTLALDAEQTLTQGTKEYSWTFTPANTDNYNQVKGTISLDVTEDTLTEISASGTLDKTSYVYGESFDITGLTVTAAFESGLTANVTEEVTFGTLQAGDTSITLSYTEDGVTKICTATGIRVYKATQVGFTIAGAPTTFAYGDAFTLGTSGGSGDGAVTWSITAGTASTVDASTGKVSIKDLTPFTVTAIKSGGNNYYEAAAILRIIPAKAALTVTADSQTVNIGASLPTLTYQVTGLVNGDSFTNPTLSTTASDTSAAGTFDISISGGTLSNAGCYDVTWQAGTLTVVPHRWAAAWSNDESHHWHECLETDCPITDNSAKDGYGSHSFGQDQVCDQCGFSRVHTITFDPNGGKVSPRSGKTGADGTLDGLPRPKREDYVFEGWYTARRGGKKVTPSTVFTEDTTIYAHWSYHPTDSDSPQTGDTTRNGLWLGLAAVGLLGLTASLTGKKYYRKRR